ncbi:zinc finger and BTB domain-containing protein 24-like [Ptychodera flava]|uniref:zinc finger and BTB domain-containing protein 24-like n=1 Tax=Ptychodera flava TaxID=63121 RepID=UPI00396A48A0
METEESAHYKVVAEDVKDGIAVLHEDASDGETANNHVEVGDFARNEQNSCDEGGDSGVQKDENEQSLLIDVIISVKKREFPCHKIILASCSDFFCEFFIQSAKKSPKQGSGKVETFVVNEIPMTTMEQFLEFAYTGTVYMNRKNVQNLQTAAEFFKVPLLARGCTEFIRNHMYTVTVSGDSAMGSLSSPTDVNASIQDGQEVVNASSANNGEECDLYICTQCNKTFRNKFILNLHMKCHTDEKNNSDLDSSESSVNVPSKKRIRDPNMHNYKCDICGRGYKYKHSLNEHKRKHDNKFICSRCGKSFGRKDHLENHEGIHLDRKPYSCPKCNGGFSSLKVMKRHVCRPR